MIVTMLLNGLLQGTAIVALTYVVVRFVPERNAATRCALWFTALLALLFVPVLTAVSNAGARLFDALQPPTLASGVTISLVPVGTLAHDATALAAPAGPWILAAWLVGVMVQFSRLAISYARIQRIRRHASPSDVGGDQVLVSHDIAIPIAAGVLKPVVIVPAAVVEALSAEDLKRVVAHERAHIRRNDVASNLIQRSIEAVLFFNPWVYLVARNLVDEREAACDDVAVGRTGTPDDYARCLAALAHGIRHRQSPLLTPSAFGSRKSVVVRIERLIRNGASAATSLNYYAIGGTIVLFAILTLVLQTLSPASSAYASPALPSHEAIASTACGTPNADAQIRTAASPEMPHSAGTLKGSVNVLVTIAPNGKVSSATVQHSSGNPQVDAAVVNAAKASTYSPARKNCAAVVGQYLFHAEFQPN